jgi:hypothetical protein
MKVTAIRRRELYQQKSIFPKSEIGMESALNVYIFPTFYIRLPGSVDNDALHTSVTF